MSPPTAPTDPYVRTLAHTVLLILDSPRSKMLCARAAILGRYGDTWYRVRSLGRSSRPRFQCQTPPYGFSFPPQGPPGSSSPASTVLSKRYDFQPPILPHFVSFVWQYLGCTRCFAPRRTSAPSRPGVVRPALHPGIYRGDMLVLPSSWGISIVRLHMFQSDAGRTACTRPLRCSSVALGISKAKAPTKGLSKLNSMAFGLAAGTVRSMVGFAVRITPTPRKTRFRLLVRLYRTGFPPARFR